MSQLPADCLNKIFEYFEEEDENFTLNSCILVNRLWCETSVGILWKSIRNYRTLIACLPSELKKLLYKDEIITSTLILKTPTFNYVSFCKILQVNRFNFKIEQFLKNQKPDISLNNICRVKREIFKLLMNFSLRKLDLDLLLDIYISQNMIFTSYPKAKDCLKYLSELLCRSDINPEFFYQLSKICYYIQTLTIIFENRISDGLTDLISVQKNLKYLDMSKFYRFFDHGNLKSIDVSFEKIPNTLIKLNLGGHRYVPFSFVAKFTNLQELILSFSYHDENADQDFEKLQYITFPQLRILTFNYGYPKDGSLIKFLEINGKNLKELHVNSHIRNHSLVSAVTMLCPNLRYITI